MGGASRASWPCLLTSRRSRRALQWMRGRTLFGARARRRGGLLAQAYSKMAIELGTSDADVENAYASMVSYIESDVNGPQ
eukprot:890545-Pleurochrysis_carterae.AAC.1